MVANCGAALTMSLEHFRQEREVEKAKYLETNLPKFPDAVARWQEYEDLILRKFGKLDLERDQALDNAWSARDRYNQSR